MNFWSWIYHLLGSYHALFPENLQGVALIFMSDSWSFIWWSFLELLCFLHVEYIEIPAPCVRYIFLMLAAPEVGVTIETSIG